MGTRFRESRFREMRFVGLELGLIIVPPSVPVAERGFKMVFFDKTGLKIGELGSDSQTAKVSQISFEILTSGCGAFSFVLDDWPAFSLADGVQVSIYPYFDASAWFTGFIQKPPILGTRRPLTFSGFGFFEQLNWVLVTKAYSTQDIAAVVADIVSTIVAPNTQVNYNAAKIVSTGYSIISLNFDHVKAMDAIQELCDTATNYEFGVDDTREFYFRPVDTTTAKNFWKGVHFQDLSVERGDPSQIKNRLYVKVGQIQAGGTNIIGSVSDSPSIAAYGLREDVITAPEILNNTDALRWAAYMLTTVKDAPIQAKVANYFLDANKVKIDLVGKIRVTTEDGTVYTLSPQRATYKITKDGMTVDLDLGELIAPLEKQLLRMIRQVQEEARLADQRTQQLY